MRFVQALHRIDALRQGLLTAMGVVLVTAALFSGPYVILRVAAAAVLGVMAVSRGKLEKLRQKFYSASKLPDEQ